MDGTYVAVVSPEQERDLVEERVCLGLRQQFQKPDQIWKGEIGTLSGIKVVRGTNPDIKLQVALKVLCSGGAIIAALVFGKDAYAVPVWKGENSRVLRFTRLPIQIQGIRSVNGKHLSGRRCITASVWRPGTESLLQSKPLTQET
jgi:N4-gp56 family major capsid protein